MTQLVQRRQIDASRVRAPLDCRRIEHGGLGCGRDEGFALQWKIPDKSSLDRSELWSDRVFLQMQLRQCQVSVNRPCSDGFPKPGCRLGQGTCLAPGHCRPGQVGMPGKQRIAADRIYDRKIVSRPPSRVTARIIQGKVVPFPPADGHFRAKLVRKERRQLQQKAGVGFAGDEVAPLLLTLLNLLFKVHAESDMDLEKK